jgi:hypothetical protein
MVQCKITLDIASGLRHIVHRSNAVRRLVCFLDVSSLNLAVPQGTATFLSYSHCWRKKLYGAARNSACNRGWPSLDCALQQHGSPSCLLLGRFLPKLWRRCKAPPLFLPRVQLSPVAGWLPRRSVSQSACGCPRGRLQTLVHAGFEPRSCKAAGQFRSAMRARSPWAGHNAG